jgi:hypothetical protein
MAAPHQKIADGGLFFNAVIFQAAALFNQDKPSACEFRCWRYRGFFRDGESKGRKLEDRLPRRKRLGLRGSFCF